MTKAKVEEQVKKALMDWNESYQIAGFVWQPQTEPEKRAKCHHFYVDVKTDSGIGFRRVNDLEGVVAYSVMPKHRQPEVMTLLGRWVEKEQRQAVATWQRTNG